MLLLLSRVAIYWPYFQWRASQKRRVKLCYLINVQSTYFVRQIWVENVRVLISFSMMPLYSSGGHSNMAAVGFSFPTIDARSSLIFQISCWDRQWLQYINQTNFDMICHIFFQQTDSVICIINIKVNFNQVSWEDTLLSRRYKYKFNQN